MADKAADKKETKKKSGKLRFYTIVTLLVIASPFILPTIILAGIGMLPTLVELFIDKEHEKSSTAAVGAMNFAGTTPFIIDLWMKGQSMDDAFHLMMSANFWLLSLGTAAVGKLIVFAIPNAMALLTFARYEARVKILKNNLEQLSTTWGPDVGTVKPLDKIVRMD